MSAPIIGSDETTEAGDDDVGAALLAAIISEPDLLEHRLVYADWLTSRGDPQGELIVLCERQRSEYDSSLNARITMLVREHGDRIAGDATELAHPYYVERGLLNCVGMSAQRFAEHGARLLAAHPITELQPQVASAEDLACLARTEALARIRHLNIQRHIDSVRPMPFDSLLASPHFDALESLTVWGWLCTGDPEAAFAGLRAPKLRELGLHLVDRIDRALAGLARASGIELHKLDLHGLGQTDWTSALAAPTFARLRTIRLHASGPGIGTLFEGATLPELRTLGLGDEVPMDALCLPSLSELEVGRVKLDEDQLSGLFDRHPKLERLRIGTLQGLHIDRALELALALPDQHPLRALQLPMTDADPDLVQAASHRFGMPRKYKMSAR